MAMMPDLTARQAQLLAWMRAEPWSLPAAAIAWGVHGYGTAGQVRVSVIEGLEALEARGLVTRHPGQPARWSATPEER